VKGISENILLKYITRCLSLIVRLKISSDFLIVETLDFSLANFIKQSIPRDVGSGRNHRSFIKVNREI
jgi:hypothetical protein